MLELYHLSLYLLKILLFWWNHRNIIIFRNADCCSNCMDTEQKMQRNLSQKALEKCESIFDDNINIITVAVIKDALILSTQMKKSGINGFVYQPKFTKI